MGHCKSRLSVSFCGTTFTRHWQCSGRTAVPAIADSWGLGFMTKTIGTRIRDGCFCTNASSMAALMRHLSQEVVIKHSPCWHGNSAPLMRVMRVWRSHVIPRLAVGVGWWFLVNTQQSVILFFWEQLVHRHPGSCNPCHSLTC